MDIQTMILDQQCRCNESYGTENAQGAIVCDGCGMPYEAASIEKIEAEIERQDFLIKAAENWHNQYRKNKKNFIALLKAEAKFERILRGYFRAFADRSIDYVDWFEYEQLRRSIQAADFDIDITINDGPLGNEAGIMFNVIYEVVEDVTTLGGQAGESLSNVDIGTRKTSDYIQKTAKQTAARLVGKRVDKDGIVVDNPRAKYRVSDTVRKDIRSSVSTSLSLSESQADAINRLKSVIANPKRAELIARTETVNAYQNGVLAMGLESGAVGKEWRSVNPLDICGTYARRKVIPIKESFDPDKNVQAPGAHPNCVVGSTTVHSTSNRAATRRIYKGWMIKITTATGNKLSITPNHPVLTARGWIKAGELRKTDNLISCVDPQRVSSEINPDNNYTPTSIKKIFKSFRRSSGVTTASTMPSTAVDFHGDKSKGKVDIVRANSFLGGDAFNSEVFQPTHQDKLVGANAQLLSLSRDSAFNFFFKRVPSASSSVMSRLNIRSILRFGSFRHHQPIGFSRSANSDTFFAEDPSYNGTADTELGSKLIDRFTGNVFADDIAKIKRVPYFGHVYNLETDTGWYISNNIVTHNCRCSLRLVYPEDPTAEQLQQPTNPGSDLSTVYHGTGHNLNNGNYAFGDTFYVTRDKGVAETFGKVKKHTIAIAKSDILFVDTNELYRNLVQKALLQFPGENLNASFPKYILNLGYKAVEMSPDIDPLGGIAIVDKSLIP